MKQGTPKEWEYHVYGLGGLFKVSATDDEHAVQRAREIGLVSASWVKRVSGPDHKLSATWLICDLAGAEFMRRSPIDRSPKLKVGARVQVIVGFRAGSHDGVVEKPMIGQDDFWLVGFSDGGKGAYQSEHLRVLPKLTSSNPVNRKRKDAQFEKAFGKDGRDGKWIRSQPCSVPECLTGEPTQAHHAKTQGAGGDRQHLVPLCAFHHAAFHSAGRKSFDRYYRVDLMEIAAQASRTRELEWADQETNE